MIAVNTTWTARTSDTSIIGRALTIMPAHIHCIVYTQEKYSLAGCVIRENNINDWCFTWQKSTPRDRVSDPGGCCKRTMPKLAKMIITCTVGLIIRSNDTGETVLGIHFFNRQ